MGPESNTLKFCDKTTPSIGIRSSDGGGGGWKERNGEGEESYRGAAHVAAVCNTRSPSGAQEKPWQRHPASLAVAAGDPP